MTRRQWENANRPGHELTLPDMIRRDAADARAEEAYAGRELEYDPTLGCPGRGIAPRAPTAEENRLASQRDQKRWALSAARRDA